MSFIRGSRRMLSGALLLACGAVFMAGGQVRAADEAKGGKALYTLDFSGKKGKNARDWLQNENFKLQKDAKDPECIGYSFNADSILIEAKCKTFGFAMQETPLVAAKKIRITWGVKKYPDGASWEKGVHREALMVYVFYGKEKVDSGSWYLPNSPYYVGLYLSDSDIKDKVYLGRSYQTCGRYVCIGNPKPGETITSEYDIDAAFKKMFDKGKTPAVSGISLEVDTGDTTDGLSLAFVSKIELLE